MTFREQLLQQFAGWLEAQTDLKPNTRRRYVSLVNCLLKNTYLTHIDQLATVDIPAFLRSQPYGYQVKQHINALDYFQQFVGGRLKYSKAYAAIARDKPDKPPNRWEPMDYDKVVRTINGIHNAKLRIAYRLMLATGMREAEVASVTKGDIALSTDAAVFHLKDTKNGQAIDISCTDPYIVNALPQLIKGLQDADKVFYSDRMLREKAEAYGFMCHDLRRAFASDYYQSCLESGSNPREARRQTADVMRHSLVATTKLYLSRDIRHKGSKKGAHRK